jgi:hypothetical protein
MFGHIDVPGHTKEAIGISHWMFSTAIQNCMPDRFVPVQDEIWYALEHYLGDRLHDMPNNLLQYVEAQSFNYHYNVINYFCQLNPVEHIPTPDNQLGVAIVVKE